MSKPTVLGASWGDIDGDGMIMAQVIVQGNPSSVSIYLDDEGNPVTQTDIIPVPFTFQAVDAGDDVYGFIVANYR